jgi:hypothetical protein
MTWRRKMLPHRRHKNQDVHHHENGNRRIPPPPPPFYNGVHLALAQFMAETTRQFAEAIVQIPQPNQRVGHLGYSLCDFSSHNFRLFEGIEKIHIAEAWLTVIDVLFDTLGYTNEQKVWYIRLKLTGEVRRWWTSKKVLFLEPENKTEITWELFKIDYNRRFFPKLKGIESYRVSKSSLGRHDGGKIFRQIYRTS